MAKYPWRYIVTSIGSLITKTYGSDNVDKTSGNKLILVDLGIIVYNDKKEKQSQLALKEIKNKKQQKTMTVTPAKKARRIISENDVFTAPKVLIIDLMSPIEFCTKSDVARTDTTTPLVSVTTVQTSKIWTFEATKKCQSYPL